MAERRMFSRRIVESARFLKLPASAQMLYFHLGMAADDDGIAEGFSVVRVAGCTEEDLQLLEEKGFVQILNEDLVTYLVDWEANNRIRADRKTDSIYKELLTDTCQADDGQMSGTCQKNDRIGKVSIGKDSIGKDIKEREGEKKPQKRFSPPTIEEVRAYITEKGYTDVDPVRFVSFYASKNWMVGKNKMTSWKSSVAGWSARNKAEDAEKRAGPKNKYAESNCQRDYDFDELERKARR